MSVSSLDPVIARAAEHMVRQHGRHAADFAEFRSRELQALGSAAAAELWGAVAERIRQSWRDGPASQSDRCVA